MAITDQTRIIDLNVGEFKQLVNKLLVESGNSLFVMGSSFAPIHLESVPIEKLVELTGWSKSCIYKKCSLRQIPHFKVGKELRFNIAEINDWINKMKRKTGDELVVDFEARQKTIIKKLDN